MSTRREFIGGFGRIAAALGTLPALRVVAAPKAAVDLEAYAATALPAGTPILVSITLDGGNDWLDTVVPVTNPWYNDPTYGHGALALTAAQTLALDGTAYRLHPALAWLQNRWNAKGDVAIALGIGDDTGKSFSHFDQMKMWQTGDAQLLTPSGWLGRFNDLVQPGNPYASIALYDFRLDLLGAATSVTVVGRTSSFYVRRPEYPVSTVEANFWQSRLLNAAAGASGGVLGEAGALIARTFGMSADITGTADPNLTIDESAGPAFYLTQAALMIRAGIPCQSYSYAFGPFDTHGDQIERQADLLVKLDAALKALFDTLAGSPRLDDVIVLITSEFGRQVTVNASGGTDHGLGGMGIVLGRGVQGGLYGEMPTLDPGGPTRPNRTYDALKVTTNFRRLHAAVANTLAGDSGTGEAIFGSGFGAPLPIFEAAPGNIVFASGFE